jgi:hypothetical protein
MKHMVAYSKIPAHIYKSSTMGGYLPQKASAGRPVVFWWFRVPNKEKMVLSASGHTSKINSIQFNLDSQKYIQLVYM